MADEDPGASSSARPEQKSLVDDVTHVSGTETPSTEDDLEFVDARERTHSMSTQRSSFFDAQRTEARPTSSSSLAGKGKGKKANVDFADPPETSVRDSTATGHTTIRPVSPEVQPAYREPPVVVASPISPVSASSDVTARPVHFREPPESPAVASSSTDARPVHSRGNSYTNFSRPDRQLNSKSPVPPSIIKTRNSITALPKRTSSISRTSINKQNRISGTSTVASKRARPSDLERGKSGSDETAPVPPFPQSLAAGLPTSKKDADEPKPTWLTELYTISYLIFFAFFGTLARLGIEWLTFYPGAIITTPVVWANLAGSLLMGFLVEDTRLFRDHWPEYVSSTSRAEKRMSKQSNKSRRSAFSGDFDRMMRRERLKIKAKVPLYIGLTTGFCGCFTSFSLFARDMFLALSNDLPAPPYAPNTALAGYNIARSGGYSFMALLAVIITEMTLSIGGFIAGRQLALLFEDYTPRLPTVFTKTVLDRLVVVLAFGCWLGSIFLMIFPPDRPGGPVSTGSWSTEYWRGVSLFALVFAPLGCLARYYMSKTLNKLEPSFPLGTFAANLLGAAVLAACYDIQHIGIGDGGIVGGGLISCQALEGLIDGFTGCLTTVSTFVAELDSLKRKYAWIYGFSTIVAGFCLMLVIMGPVRWTVGWSNPACVTGYVNKYS